MRDEDPPPALNAVNPFVAHEPIGACAPDTQDGGQLVYCHRKRDIIHTTIPRDEVCHGCPDGCAEQGSGAVWDPRDLCEERAHADGLSGQ